MIQLNVVEESPEGMYKVVRLSGVFWNKRHSFGQVTDFEIRMLSVCIIREEKRKEV